MDESGFVTATLLPTKFADPVREDSLHVFRRYHTLRKSPNIEVVLNAVPYMSLILNEYRQVVFGNTALLDMMSISDIADVIGLRPGEIIHCIHADTEPFGCGTAEHCQVCGAVRTILRCFNDGKATSGEACLTIGFDHTTQPLDVTVTANPFEFQEDRYVIVTIRDISNEKRTQSLERVFLHDIANVVGGVVGMVDLMTTEKQGDDENARLLSVAVRQLYDEIHAQQQLIRAEKNELEVHPGLINVSELLEEVATLFGTRTNGYAGTVEISCPKMVTRFYSDRTLLFRVLCNMVKNAIEASGKHHTVSVFTDIVGSNIVFKVHNATYIPYAVQLQVFQRSFSTHGKGRGLGTYSMKLLSERYLKGKVFFRSTEDDGTTFFASYPVDIRTV